MMGKDSIENRKKLRGHAREALRAYSPVMTWLLLDEDGDLSILEEPQGQTFYTGKKEVIATTGGFAKAHGDGAARDSDGMPYKTQWDYLLATFGEEFLKDFGFNWGEKND